ncbi:AAWKG family protein [Streptomyces sp. NBC_01275]|uniref:AAWKG family protein n=1 Tax=Streptomyces sp. NBC_01275 TaxID=2903807 RepID=UPI0022558CE7|nr:AAWKG family protein [Streptomyces sp. NBC_01275]MCX4765868.1 AAWKG family protein [Streptomyces sp. NBC_01275]
MTFNILHDEYIRDLTDTDDWWHRAVELLTGLSPLPKRTSVFEQWIGNHGIPLMLVELTKQKSVTYVDFDDLDWRSENVGADISKTDFVIPFYTRGGDDGEGSEVAYYKARITLLISSSSDPADGGVRTGVEVKSKYKERLGLKDDDLIWDNKNFVKYSYAGGLALKTALNYDDDEATDNGTYGFYWDGIDVPADASVVLRTFDGVADSFDRLARFFKRSADETERWKQWIGTEDNNAWQGTAAGVFQDLIHKIARVYEGYAEDTVRHAGGSIQGQKIREARKALHQGMDDLYWAWDYWQRNYSNPLRWLMDRLLELADWVWDHNIMKIGYTSSTTSDGDGNWTTTKDYYTKGGFSQNAKLDFGTQDFGRLDSLDTWKKIGDLAVQLWQAGVTEHLSVPAKDILTSVHNAWSPQTFDIGEIRTRTTGDTLKADWQEDQAKKDQAEADAKAAKAEADAKAAAAAVAEQYKKDKEEAEAAAAAAAEQYKKDKEAAAAAAAAAEERYKRDKEEAEAAAKAAAEKYEREKAEAEAEAAAKEAEAEAKYEREKAEQEAEQARQEAEAEARYQQEKADQEAAEAEAEERNEREQAEQDAEQAEQEAAAEARYQQEQAKQDAAEAEQAAQQEQEKAEQKAAEAEAQERYDQEKAEQKAEQEEAAAQQAAYQQQQFAFQQQQARQQREDEERARKEAAAQQAEQEAKQEAAEAEQKAEQQQAEAEQKAEQQAAEEKYEREQAEQKAEQARQEAEQKAEQARLEAKQDAQQAEQEAAQEARYQEEKAEQVRQEAEQKAEQVRLEAKQDAQQAEEEAKQEAQQTAADARYEQEKAEQKAEQARQEARQDAKEAEAQARYDQEQAEQKAEQARQEAKQDTIRTEAQAREDEYRQQQLQAQEDYQSRYESSLNDPADNLVNGPVNGSGSLTNPDGSTSYIDSQGRVITDFADGTKTIVDPDLQTSTVIRPDGQSVTGPLNADEVLNNPDGSRTYVDSQGQVVTDYPDGSKATVDPDSGVTTVTEPNGNSTTGYLNNGGSGYQYQDTTAQLPSYEEELYDNAAYGDSASDYLAGNTAAAAQQQQQSQMPMGGMPLNGMQSPRGGGGSGEGSGERVRNVIDSDGAISNRARSASRSSNGGFDEREATVATSGGTPFMPPMGGGGSGGPGQQQTESGDRVRDTWVQEDEDVWGTDEGGAPAVIGR